MFGHYNTKFGHYNNTFNDINIIPLATPADNATSVAVHVSPPKQRAFDTNWYPTLSGPTFT